MDLPSLILVYKGYSYVPLFTAICSNLPSSGRHLLTYSVCSSPRVKYIYCCNQLEHKSQGAYTTESSRVQSSPVRLTKSRQSLCGLHKMAAAAVRTQQQSPVQSNPTSFAESRVLMMHVSFSLVRLQLSRVMASILRNKWIWKQC